MTGFRSVGADEADVGVGVQNGALFAVSLDGAVEEDNGGAVRQRDDLVGNVGGAGSDHVDDQQVVAVGDSGLDLLVLGGLVVVAVEVVVGNAQAVQLCVQSGTDAGNVGVGEGVVEHADLQLGSLRISRGVRGGGVFGGGVSRGRVGRSGVRGGLVSRGVLAGAGDHRDKHDQRKHECKNLFHDVSSIVCFSDARSLALCICIIADISKSPSQKSTLFF